MAESKSQSTWFRELSAEFFLGFLAMVFAVGGTWATLSQQVEANEDRLREVVATQEQRTAHINDIKVTVQRLETNQMHFQSSMSEIKSDIKETQKAINDVLKEIRDVNQRRD